MTAEKEPRTFTGAVGVADRRLALVSDDPRRIEAFRREHPGVREIDGTGKVLMPGLINTHCHVAMTLQRGYADDIALMKCVCSTEFIVYKAKSQDLTDFLYSVIDSTSFSDFMCSHVTGSTGSRQRTTPYDTLAFELVLPNAEEIAEYQGVVSPMFEQIKCNAIENDRLKRLRDSLLPKLMSGELDVSSIQL